MDLLDRLLGHDWWTTDRLLEIAGQLSDEQLDQPFDIGHRTIRATLVHLIRNMEVWSALISGEMPPEVGDGQSTPDLRTRLSAAAEKLSAVAAFVRANGGWDETFTDLLDGKDKTYGGAIAHIVTHSMHHRAQLLYLLRLSGVKDLPEGDIFSWEDSLP